MDTNPRQMLKRVDFLQKSIQGGDVKAAQQHIRSLFVTSPKQYVVTKLRRKLMLIFLKEIGSFQKWVLVDKLLNNGNEESFLEVARYMALEPKVKLCHYIHVISRLPSSSYEDLALVFHDYPLITSALVHFENGLNTMVEKDWRLCLKKCLDEKRGESIFWGMEIALRGNKRNIGRKRLPVFQVFEQLSKFVPCDVINVAKRWYYEFRLREEDCHFCWILLILYVIPLPFDRSADLCENLVKMHNGNDINLMRPLSSPPPPFPPHM